MGKFKEIMTDIQNLQEQMKRMDDHLTRLDRKMTSVMDARAVFDTQRRQYHSLAEKVSAIEDRMQEIVEINQMHIDTINEEDDDIEKLDNRLKKVERELNPAIADAGGKIAKWMNRLEKVERILGANFGSIRELEVEDKAIQEELTELQEIVRQLSVKMNVLEGVKDYQENVKPTFTCIGAYLDNRYKSAGFVAREDFYKKYTFLCGMLNALPLDEDQLMATPIEDWPTKYD